MYVIVNVSVAIFCLKNKSLLTLMIQVISKSDFIISRIRVHPRVSVQGSLVHPHILRVTDLQPFFDTPTHYASLLRYLVDTVLNGSKNGQFLNPPSLFADIIEGWSLTNFKTFFKQMSKFSHFLDEWNCNKKTTSKL